MLRKPSENRIVSFVGLSLSICPQEQHPPREDLCIIYTTTRTWEHELDLLAIVSRDHKFRNFLYRLLTVCIHVPNEATQLDRLLGQDCRSLLTYVVNRVCSHNASSFQKCMN